MGKLGDFLEVVYGPDERFQTLCATIHQWWEPKAAKRVEAKERIGRRKADREQLAAIEEADLSVSVNLPDRFRVERTRRTQEGIKKSIEIINGKRSWLIDDEGHVETATEERREVARCTDIDRHFHRWLLREFFNGLHLRLIGECRAAEQDCLRIQAVPRPHALLWPHWLPHGAEEYEFHADPARGVLLGIIARVAGKVFEVNEVTAIAFDPALDPALFTHTAEIGEQTREREPITEHLSLSAAILRVPFKVLVPTRVPDADHSQFEIMYHPARMRFPRAYLSFMYRGSTEYDSLWIYQSGSPRSDFAEFEWETLDRSGRRLQISDPGAEGRRIVMFEQEATYVEIISDIERERLLDLATSFAAATK